VRLKSLEICAGAGGQALGLEQGGFDHLAVVEHDRHACATLRVNRPYWDVLREDVKTWDATRYQGQVDLFAAGVPCPPFSKAGKQLGAKDDRDLFPHAMRLVRQCGPQAVMFENVRGFLDASFENYRADLDLQLRDAGYITFWKLHQASNYGVPQLRPRTVIVGLRKEAARHFAWPRPCNEPPPTVGEALFELMASAGWEGAAAWAAGADKIAPTLVGGSHRHGGPDLGPTRARKAWAEIGVNGKVLANEPPPPGFVGMPSLTVAMAAVIQGFPPSWRLMGPKTHAYRQIGNAFPPAVARAVGMALADALHKGSRDIRQSAEPVAA
jgi:DNA (cytosine-5)-methyltransferase 1